MSVTTNRERQRKLVRRLIVLGVVLLIIALLIFVPTLRTDALAVTGLLENLRDAKGATATIAVTVLILLAVVENAEKLTFIWETGHKLLGYDLEIMARHEREFNELPDDYVRRPAMERQLIEELAPGREPKLVVFTEEHDAGKTTLLHYIVPRHLNRPYHGAVINCRGDVQSIEGEIGEDDEHRRRRLTKRVLRRVIQHAEVPGDIGETIESMRDAIVEHFGRESTKPWFIIIDQVDSPNFPYQETLPALFGGCNTVLVVSNRAQIEPRAYTIVSEEGERVALRRDIHLQPFTADEALSMFQQEVKKRHGTLPRQAAEALNTRLEGTWPGAVQRLSDIYVNGGGVAGVERALDPSVTGARRANSINATIVEELPHALKCFVAGLSLLASNVVSESALKALAATDPCNAEPYAELVEQCKRRQYLAQAPVDHLAHRQHMSTRYTITKLGRSFAQLSLRAIGDAIELRLGSALLEFYRGIDKQRLDADIHTELPNILGVMSWAEMISRLPDRDVIRFTRHIGDALYHSGQWDVGLWWLRYSEQAAMRLSLVRSVGELASARAQLLLAGGKATSALAAIDLAQTAFGHSIAQVETDLRLGSAPEDLLLASRDYDALQRRWLAHLQVGARMALLTARSDEATVAALAQPIEAASAWLNDTREGVTANGRIAELLAIELRLDRIQIALLEGDVALQDAAPQRAVALWRAAREQISELRESLSSAPHLSTAQRALFAQAERIDGMLCRRYAAHAGLVRRWYWYVRANQRLTQSFRLARGLRYEMMLTRFENANLQLVGVTLNTRKWKGAWYQSSLRRAATRFMPQWYRLRTAHQQLLKTNADAAALSAQAVQFSTFTALSKVTRQLGRLERNPAYLRASAEYLHSAESIAQRLRDEMPNLWEQERMPNGEGLSLDASMLAASPHDSFVSAG